MQQTDINLEDMTVEELQLLINKAHKAMKTVDSRRKADAKRAAEKAAKEYGFSLEEIIGAGGKTSKGSKGVAKYANPDDASQTWTGRGRKPNWVIAAVEGGKSLDDLAL